MYIFLWRGGGVSRFRFLGKYPKLQIIKVFNNPFSKNVFTVNNKIVIQKDDDTSIYSLKNVDESQRLLMLLQDEFIRLKRADAIFVKDMDTIQRKYLYEHLEKLGIDKKRLYRQSTTFSERK